jgi:glycosyltransferase involved in cell wall biosynthesis
LKRLNILQLFAQYLLYGGEEGSVTRIAMALRNQHDVEYFMESTKDLLEGGICNRAMLPLLAIHNWRSAKALREIQERKRFDCWQIHNVFPAISPSAYSTAFNMGVPVIHYLHNYKFGCPTGFMFAKGREYSEGLQGNFLPAIRDGIWHDSRLKTAVMAAAITYARKMGVFHRVTRWVAISHAEKRICVSMGIPAENIDVVHHFVETTDGDPAPLPMNGDALFIGRLSPEKGVDRLIEAWRQLGANRQLVIAGDGPEFGRLQAMIAEYELKNVKMLGFVPKSQQDELWKNTAFSLVPSIWEEPFGMVVLESWAHGRPVVAHKIGALTEIIRHGETGFLADPHDTADLASKIETAFSTTPAELREMGIAGHKELSGHYSKARWIGEINDVYRKAGLLNPA